MKPIRALGAFTAVLFCVAAFGVQARTFDDIKKDGKIIIATEGAYPPFNYFQGSSLTGFEIELGEALAKKMGVKLEWKALAFDALLAGLRYDRWDAVIAGVTVTDERSKAVTFTDPHWCSGGVVVAKDPAIRNAKDLAGKVVAVQTGTTYLDNVKKISGVKEVRNFPQDTDARSALISNRVDAWVSDKFVAKIAAQANPSAGLNVGELLWVERNAPVVAKGNTSLAQAINRALAEVVADGTYATLSNKYLKENVACH
jgi:polar amino acid transport system substrate-binding protein